MFFCHSYYSLRYGTRSPEQLIAQALDCQIDTLILADINNTGIIPDFIDLCRKRGIRPLAGIDFRTPDYQPLYWGLAQNTEGWRELCHFYTQYNLEDKSLPEFPPFFQHAYIIYPYGTRTHEDLNEHEYIGITPAQARTLVSTSYRQYPTDKLIALPLVTIKDKEDYDTHKLLRAIDQNTLLSKLQPCDLAHPSEHICKRWELEKSYDLYPFLLRNTERLLTHCSIDLNLLSSKTKKNFTSRKEDDLALLNKLAYEGFNQRYDAQDQKAFDRMQKELEVIDQMDFQAYYLIAHDMIQYAQHRGYHHVGRGSGANSMVAYCMRITDVDPIELDLYFERFINPHRTSPPDFDIDFSHDQRDEVIDYLFKRYGQEHVALLATYSTFQGSSIIREIGKALGIPKTDIDKIVDYPEEKDKHHALGKLVFKYGEKLVDFPNHRSIHAGGVLITEEPLTQYTCLEQMPKGFPVTHFDMYTAEEYGFYKLDVLSQRGLGHIKEAVDLIRQNQQVILDIHRIETFKKDPQVKEKLKKAQTIGCFYIESPAMRGLLSKLKCDDYLTLVAASSIIRPGVASSGMMREYIERFHHREKINYLHPAFEEHLGETFGVMVYQEDVIKIAHHFGGLELFEADVLRRLMSGKGRNKDQFRELRKKFWANCQQRGYPETLTQEVWRQIESFAGYAFCKAHSASYAVESYQSLYLKTYYPLEFMTAVINNFGGFYNTELYIHEARMAGAQVEAPCVNHSHYYTHIQGNIMYLGLVHLKGLEKNAALYLLEERKKRGPFKTLADFVQRTVFKKEQLEILIRIGAFRFTRQSKQRLLWEKNSHLQHARQNAGMFSLFSEGLIEPALPPLETDLYEEVHEQMSLLGFPLISPLRLIIDKPQDTLLTREMKASAGTRVRMIGYFVARKVVYTKNDKIMNFGTWVDDEGHFFDSTHFPQSLEKYPFRGKGCYLMEGKIVLDFDFPMLEVERMEKLNTHLPEQ